MTGSHDRYRFTFFSLLEIDKLFSKVIIPLDKESGSSVPGGAQHPGERAGRAAFLIEGGFAGGRLLGMGRGEGAWVSQTGLWWRQQKLLFPEHGRPPLHAVPVEEEEAVARSPWHSVAQASLSPAG